ncbi:uncharacterized protein LOC126843344 [Adelges cooleyi]|uniref:uncharacterized protein LOC126843344 n=1 Tax=Adelges cooleyi TaxID=133065 RepID=UPI002180663C|nr:uncharacterized protein LOC126843344 [Adelges cooleyi]
MLGKVSIGFLFFYVIITNSEQTFASRAVKKNLSAVLSALLGHQQWAKITDVKTKHPDFPNEIVWFSGKDLFTYRGLFSRIKNTASSYFSLENVYKKHYMVIIWLACVYAKATDTFTKLIMNILSVSSNERRLSQHRVFLKKRQRNFKKIRSEKMHRKQMPSKRLRTEVQYDHPSLDENSDNSGDTAHISDDENEDVEDHVYDLTWTIFNYTYQKLLNSQLMFEYMYDALNYLFKLIPPEVYVLRLSMEHIQQYVLTVVMWFKDISVNLEICFPTYIGELDVEYKSKGQQFVSKLKRFINSMNHFWLRPFLEKYCIIPVKENQDIKVLIKNFQTEFKCQNRSDIIYQFGTQINQLVIKVINNLYVDLGFVYTKKFAFDFLSFLS